MTYTEEVKQYINKVGMQVIEFKMMIKKITKLLNELFYKVKSVMDSVIKTFRELPKIPPRQRYMVCKQLGIKNYECLFQRKQVYRVRSNC